MYACQPYLVKELYHTLAMIRYEQTREARSRQARKNGVRERDGHDQDWTRLTMEKKLQQRQR
jgi:hypothetical protein